jgi:hypothetical protein
MRIGRPPERRRPLGTVELAPERPRSSTVRVISGRAKIARRKFGTIKLDAEVRS